MKPTTHGRYLKPGDAVYRVNDFLGKVEVQVARVKTVTPKMVKLHPTGLAFGCRVKFDPSDEFTTTPREAVKLALRDTTDRIDRLTREQQQLEALIDADTIPVKEG